MTEILHIDSSIFSADGVSSTLSAEFVEALRARHPGARVRHRDLGAEPVPHLDAERVTAIMSPPERRSPQQQAIAAEADALIAELQAADLLVLGVPMYNFSIPSPLKAWFDHVARAGVTFKYTDSGPVGLLEGKRAVVLTSRGGIHKGAPTDTQTDLVTTFLQFLGISEIEFVYAEGLNLGDEPRRQAIDGARSELQRVAERQLLAA